jgi:hypothetical protein
MDANHNDVYDKEQGNEVDRHKKRAWRECTRAAQHQQKRGERRAEVRRMGLFLILGETDTVGRGWIPRVHFFDSYGTLFYHFDVLTECNY